jgi:transcriptional regulator GlxA family with amidase domain
MTHAPLDHDMVLMIHVVPFMVDAEPIVARLAELARSAGMGLSRFHEEFRGEIGETPAERLAATRLDRAEDLLRETHLPIAEIALAVGFSDQSALTRSFRRRRGTTPAAVRRRFS